LAVVGLSLALVGIFGITAYSVSIRTREIAVRVALGAKAQRIVGVLVRETTLLVVGGLFVGIVLSAVLSRLMRSLLHGNSPLDPAVYIAASAILLATAIIACVIPARRALTIDPASALRLE
jgi:ABC-type antimicrobial peptide transport system permease subunit